MNLIELNVPDELALLSSYSVWNEALDRMLDTSANSIDPQKIGPMFDTPLLKHSVDDIQAVVPRIHSSWIAEIRPLPPTGDNWEEGI